MNSDSDSYPPGLLALAHAHRRLLNDQRLGVCREDLLTYIDRHKRRSSAEAADNRYACTTWNGGAASSTRKVFKFLMKLFKVGNDDRFVNFGKRPADREGFVRIFRDEIKNATGLGNTAITRALARLTALNIVSRTHTRSRKNGHRHAWIRFNPSGICDALDALPRFRVCRDEVRMGRVRVARTVAENGEVSQAPKVALTELENREDVSKKNQPAVPLFSSPPMSDLGQDFSHAGSGVSGVAGLGVVAGMLPGTDVAMKGPDAPCHQQEGEKTSPAAPAEVFQPQEGTPASQPASRVSQQMLDNASNPRIQQIKEAARLAGRQLAPCGLDGGQPLLLPAGRQIIFPRLNKDGSAQQPFNTVTPPVTFTPYERPPEPSPYPRASWHPESVVTAEHDLAPTITDPARVTEFMLPHAEHEVAKVLIRIFNLREEGMNERQMKKFLTWVRNPSPAVQMNLMTLGLYERRKEGQHNEKDWWLECKLDFFLNAWPKITKKVQADDAAMSAFQDERFQLACIAYSRPEHFLNIQIRIAAEHLAFTRFVRRGVETKYWLICPGEITDPEACASFYMENLRNPAIAPFMASTDANGAITAARAGVDMTGGPMLRAKEALDSHLIVMLVESSRRKEHWAELDTDWVRQQARRMINDSEPLRRVFEHFGVFSNYRDIGFVSAATAAPHLVPGRDAEQIREHYDVQIEAARVSKQRFELGFFGRLASLACYLEDADLEDADLAMQNYVLNLLQPFFHAC